MTTRSRGFTLLEVVIMLAVLSVVAGIMAPYAAREIDAGRREATQREMEAIENALLEYYSDCGRLPDPKVGLVALTENAESLPGWSGPYVGGGGNLADAVTRDAWGELYAYDRDPQIKSAPAMDYLIISGSKDHTIESKQQSGSWTLEAESDLILQGLTQKIDTGWESDVRTTLDEVAEGLEEYFLDVETFPEGTDSTALVQLVNSKASSWAGPYVRETAAALARDPWGGAIQLRPCTELNGEDVDGWLLLSTGPGAPDVRWKITRCQTGQNDIYRLVARNRLTVLLDRERQEEAGKTLKLIAAEVMIASPTQSPTTAAMVQIDPWGQAYRYCKMTTQSGIIYSVGANGIDENAGGDDIYESILWPLSKP